jgi:hypothetical protein
MPDPGSAERELWKEAVSPTEACLTIEELGRWSDQWLPDRAPVASAHIARCPRCQAELAMLNEFQSAATRPEDADSVSWITAELERRFDQIRVAAPLTAPRPGLRSERSRWVQYLFGPRPLRGALGFAGLLALIAAVLQLRGAQEPELSSDAVSGPVVMRSEELVALSPTGDLKQAPRELRWQATPGAARYLVKVMEVDRTELWKTESSLTSASLPTALVARIVPGKKLLWQVTAIDSAGRTVATSQILPFRLAIDPGSSKN